MNSEKTNQDKRVLGRKGARELESMELDHVTGGVRTQTACTFNPTTKTADGDHSIGEC